MADQEKKPLADILLVHEGNDPVARLAVVIPHGYHSETGEAIFAKSTAATLHAQGKLSKTRPPVLPVGQ